jgi:hypothetical protein
MSLENTLENDAFHTFEIPFFFVGMMLYGSFFWGLPRMCFLKMSLENTLENDAFQQHTFEILFFVGIG